MKMLKRLWRRFWCLHYWKKEGLVEAGWPWGCKYEYRCYECAKSIHRWNDNIPIGGIITNPKNIKKDPRFHASPYVIHFDD